MAGAPKYKVYIGNHYIAATKFVEDAAAIVAANCNGTIRVSHSRTGIVFTEGEDASAGNSYDDVVSIVHTRENLLVAKTELRNLQPRITKKIATEEDRTRYDAWQKREEVLREELNQLLAQAQS